MYFIGNVTIDISNVNYSCLSNIDYIDSLYCHQLTYTISYNFFSDTLSTSSSVYDDSCVPTLDEVLKTSYLHVRGIINITILRYQFIKCCIVIIHLCASCKLLSIYKLSV